LACHTLIFSTHSTSRYSAAALLGAVEIDPRLTDMRIEAPTRLTNRLLEDSLEQGGVAVAYSVMSTQTDRIYREVKRLHDRFPDSLVLIGGGPHASARPREILQNGFDIAVVGEGEKTLPDLLNSLMLEEDIGEMPGVVTDIESECPLPRDLPQVDLDRYPPFALRKNVVGPIEVTRGCPFACKFCCTPFLTGGRVRHRSVESIVQWLEKAVAESGFERTWFLSPNALSYGGRGRTVDSNKIEELLKRSTEIDGLGEVFFGSFPSEVRPEFVSRQVLDMMRGYVANDTLQIGLQSGSDEVLRLANRHHTVEEGMTAVRVALDSDFIPHVDMIFGLPGESETERHRSIELCYELAEMGARTHGHVFMPLPGSAFQYEEPRRLDRTSRRMLGELSRRGLMTGSWSVQEQLAEQLASSRSNDSC
jgi:B12-binding domain/radical SAM domain protein